MNFRLLFIGLFIAGCTFSSEVKVTGTYSNLRAGIDDLAGAEFTVVYGGNSYYVIVQCSEGAPGIPNVVPASVENLNITFQVTSASSGCPAEPFKGTITSEGLSGSFQDAWWPGFLKRGKSYWQ